MRVSKRFQTSPILEQCLESKMESSQEECEKDEGFVVEIGAEEAAQLFAMGEMLNKECIEVEPGTEVPSLRELLLASGAPLRLEEDPEKGLRLVASR